MIFKEESKERVNLTQGHSLLNAVTYALDNCNQAKCFWLHLIKYRKTLGSIFLFPTNCVQCVYPHIAFELHRPWGRHQMKTFPRYWPFVRGIHRPPVNSPHKGQWHGTLMFPLICAWIDSWANNRETGDLRRNRAHYGVTVLQSRTCSISARLPNHSIWTIFFIKMYLFLLQSFSL